MGMQIKDFYDNINWINLLQLNFFGFNRETPHTWTIVLRNNTSSLEDIFVLKFKTHF